MWRYIILIVEVIIMKCIVGFGNIGKCFELIRYNIGFEVVDDILECY